MFYAVFRIEGEYSGSFYSDFGDEWHRDTFCPENEVVLIIDLHAHGKTYQNRKEDVRQKALDFTDLFSVYGVSISYGELAIFYDFFEKYGKRYGLYREFKENAIC